MQEDKAPVAMVLREAIIDADAVDILQLKRVVPEMVARRQVAVPVTVAEEVAILLVVMELDVPQAMAAVDRPEQMALDLVPEIVLLPIIPRAPILFLLIQPMETMASAAVAVVAVVVVTSVHAALALVAMAEDPMEGEVAMAVAVAQEVMEVMGEVPLLLYFGMNPRLVQYY